MWQLKRQTPALHKKTRRINLGWAIALLLLGGSMALAAVIYLIISAL
ncbi:hypothetical protein ACOGYQ_001925 [Edwardsiella piscicida]|nr:hypothetical protein [Edwardsiella piscicida]EKS7766916.1 hypothetical protein [Edwardsiella piscicida]EKS7792724.1 hypothetical protein [Edwardsiella piscicida]ELM3658884.1 hypothetical protein [Edwardsiella piscicida]ELM3727439.1 hypothetical protein [Edwardsiella piscicida]ELV7536520.1 hypothetical protein [Edwardsiella piscicida]